MSPSLSKSRVNTNPTAWELLVSLFLKCQLLLVDNLSLQLPVPSPLEMLYTPSPSYIPRKERDREREEEEQEKVSWAYSNSVDGPFGIIFNAENDNKSKRSLKVPFIFNFLLIQYPEKVRGSYAI